MAPNNAETLVTDVLSGGLPPADAPEVGLHAPLDAPQSGLYTCRGSIGRPEKFQRRIVNMARNNAETLMTDVLNGGLPPADTSRRLTPAHGEPAMLN